MGISTVMVTSSSPAGSFWEGFIGTPFPFSLKILLFCVPGGMVMRTLPERVGTEISPPKMAIVRGMVRFVSRLFFSLLKMGWGFICMETKRVFPGKDKDKMEPSSVAGGMCISTF